MLLNEMPKDKCIVYHCMILYQIWFRKDLTIVAKRHRNPKDWPKAQSGSPNVMLFPHHVNLANLGYLGKKKKKQTLVHA